MSDPVPAITEAEATGETAAIYADIRRVYGVSVVNLIWRHLATFPGALPWAWEVVRPLYVDGTIRREVAVFRSFHRLPEVAAPPPEVFAAAGLGPGDLPRIRDVLDAYDRTNPMALIALSVVQQRLGHSVTDGSGERTKARSRAPETSEPVLELPPLLRLDELAPPVAQLVLRLNRIGAARQDPVLASMYRNLAHWPGYLALAWMLLAPLDAGGGLASAIEDALSQARTRAAVIAARAPMPRAVLAPALRPAISGAIERFTGDAIARMVVVCGVLRRAGVGA
jgi:hypothetical protein